MSFENRRDVPKIRPHFDRAAHPDDSRKAERDYAIIVEGTPVPTQTTLQNILDELYLFDSDRQDDGSYAYKKGTITVKFGPTDEAGKTWKLHAIATRGHAPVISGLVYDVPEGPEGPFIVRNGFINHKNPKLDNQVINNPDMHDFTLNATMKEIRREKEPHWWHGLLQEYDKANGTKLAESFLDSLKGQDRAKIDSPHL